jgi:hypothetical protein
VWEPYDDIGIWIKRNSRSGAMAFQLRRCEPILFSSKFAKRGIDIFDYMMESFDHDEQKEVGVDDDEFDIKHQ